MIRRRPWLVSLRRQHHRSNFDFTSGFCHISFPLGCFTQMAGTFCAGGSWKGAKIISCPQRRLSSFKPPRCYKWRENLKLALISDGNYDSNYFFKLFPSAVIPGTTWRGEVLLRREIFHFLYLTQGLCHLAMTMRSCSDTGFHTPWMCANTTPLSIYSVTLPSEYKAFPSNRRLGIGINKRLFSSAWKRKKKRHTNWECFLVDAAREGFHTQSTQNCMRDWGEDWGKGWVGRVRRTGRWGGEYYPKSRLESGYWEFPKIEDSWNRHSKNLLKLLTFGPLIFPLYLFDQKDSKIHGQILTGTCATWQRNEENNSQEF